MPHPSSSFARTVRSLGATLALLISGCAAETEAEDGADAGASLATDVGETPDDATDPTTAVDSDADDSEEDSEDGEESGRVQPGEVWLRLETRAGRASEGWSLTEGTVVDAEDADLLLSSWDCGARGRWVQLEAQGVDLCHATDDGGVDVDRCGRSLEVGGSDPEVPLDGAFFVVTATEVARVVLVDRTQTPFEWYLEDDLSFEVRLFIEVDEDW